MAIERLFDKQPKTPPILVKKFKIDGNLAKTIRGIRQSVGASISTHELLLVLIEEGAKAYAMMEEARKASSGDQPVEPQPNPEA